MNNLQKRRPTEQVEKSNSHKPNGTGNGHALRGVTVSWHEIPKWVQDNEYILTGYRREQNSLAGCIHSVFAYLHNESVNIHSHLWGAVLFIFFLFTFQGHLGAYPTATGYDTAVFTIFLVSAVMCLSFSAIYHAFTCRSEATHIRCNAFDYAGIVVLTVGSFFPCVYYAFYCDPHLQAIYLTGISVAGCGAAYIVLSPKYSQPSHRWARTTVFMGLGLCALLPVTHALFAHGYHKLCFELGFNWLIASGALYITGALIYANRFPERRFVHSSNRFFDYWFASHQIFHFHVLGAVLCHYVTILKSMHHWHGVLGGTCPVS